MDTYTDDFALPLAAEFLAELLDLAEPPTLPNNDIVTFTERLEVGMPVELNMTTDSVGNLRLGMSPPTQTTMTSVFPVLHQLTLNVVADTDA